MQLMGTIPGRFGLARLGSGRLTCNAISVRLQLMLPTETEFGNIGEKEITLEIYFSYTSMRCPIVV